MPDRSPDLEAPDYAASTGVTPNWGRWGPDDQRGTLNLIGRANVLSGVAAARSGTVVSLGRPLDAGDPPYYPQGLDRAVKHEMLTAWDSNAGGDVQAASDQIHVQCHGLDTTHLDALCHVGIDGVGWNGRPFRELVDATGAEQSDIMTAGPVVTRAVLADVPRQRGVDHLQGGDPVTEADLRAIAPDVQPGDALIVRTGRGRAVAAAASAAAAEGRTAEHKYGPIAGLHPEAMRVVAELDCGLLGTDGSGDNFPAVDDRRLPIHVLALVYLGVHLLHNLALEELAQALADRGGHDFMLVSAPLRMPRGTGSPIAPVAVI